MIKLNTLDSIIDDMLNIARNGNISESESLSRNQIEQWIVQYRAILIKQDIDKGRDVNTDYIQEMNEVKMKDASFSSTGYVDTTRWQTESIIDIPKTIDFHFKPGIISIVDYSGDPIQLESEVRSNLRRNRRWTSKDYVAFRKGRKLYVSGSNEIEGVHIRLIAENPREVPGYEYSSMQYPVPANMIPIIKQMIFEKEFKVKAPSDTTNNSNNNAESI